ncbi:hypothetical protein [Yersinia massiliensis]|uniref:Uncharacterized protein n=1 Tax=Yersinia massiliensis TaxID=419257 RepID=A0ABM6UV89_9GAMM|nr:hypothetical protein [Yersinia massiliensis]AVX38808.1 hypothetical protein DA391_14670 [Yersinia massiliensis]QKJ09590.1 hypothetical protein HRD68_01830 [Yersinia massiliensis]
MTQQVFDYSVYREIKTFIGLRNDSEVNKLLDTNRWDIIAVSNGVDESDYPINSIVLGKKSS